MDTINQNQVEENRADLRGGEAIQKIRELVKKAQTCFFCTKVPPCGFGGVRPMSVQKIDDAGHLWFLSASDSHKNLELTLNPAVELYFQGSAHSGFLQLSGRATISTDKRRIEELWEPVLKNWFTEGIDDPRITVIEFVPGHGYYWDTKHGIAMAGIKILAGAVLGNTMDDSIEGNLAP